ncbi:hypothetical protein BC941DRAFT_476563 [Chlamydoabsidia padenii]|nr:hypothetical protein BC941DRAFT_477509 [Chlamydoabsidia padenii]KAI8329061.1 hypothetical protein BC941DRAFT_476563 [Chlamydoabsidia padenii]
MFTGTLLLVIFHYGWAFLLDYCVWCFMISLGFWFVFLYCYMASIFVVSCGV